MIAYRVRGLHLYEPRSGGTNVHTFDSDDDLWAWLGKVIHVGDTVAVLKAVELEEVPDRPSPLAVHPGVFHPPPGYCVGAFSGGTGGMIGPFATEKEALAALRSMAIYKIGAGATLDEDDE